MGAFSNCLTHLARVSKGTTPAGGTLGKECSCTDRLRGVFFGTITPLNSKEAGVSMDETIASVELEKAASEAGNGLEYVEQA
mmetsp:Transcript_47307/g.91261  ORF Transcript_47307/g.91261 Transcript_47307/m.91261 type:complete len:82 (-) Transcript_47307:283-528(-)